MKKYAPLCWSLVAQGRPQWAYLGLNHIAGLPLGDKGDRCDPEMKTRSLCGLRASCDR